MLCNITEMTEAVPCVCFSARLMTKGTCRYVELCTSVYIQCRHARLELANGWAACREVFDPGNYRGEVSKLAACPNYGLCVY